MLSHLTIPAVAVLLLAGVAAVSAAPREVIQNGNGTFIQDRAGTWQQYNRVRPDVAPRAVLEGAPLDQAKGNIY